MCLTLIGRSREQQQTSPNPFTRTAKADTEKRDRRGIMMNRSLLLLIVACWGLQASSASSQGLVCAIGGWRSTTTSTQSLSTMRRRKQSPSQLQPFLLSNNNHVLLASRKSKQAKKQAVEETQEESQQLGVVGNAIVGGITIVGTTVVEYLSGLVGAYVLGTVVGIPGLLYSREGLAISQRFAEMNAKSAQWAKTWAPISAVFGGCDATTRVVRGNVHDKWNTVISSAAAGAYFSRAGGPTAMLRGAAMYGGFTFVLSGGLSRPQQQFQYKEEEVEF